MHLLSRIGYGIGCTDDGTGQEITVMRSLDITADCPTAALSGRKVILDYGQGTAGRVVRIVDCVEDEDDGLQLMHYLDELEDLDGERLLPFRTLAEKFGLTPERLVILVKSMAPAEDRKKLVADMLVYAAAPDRRFDMCLKRVGLTTADLNHA
jgi:hypothetical protein